MRSPRLYRTDAIVLKRSDLGEADRLTTVYTPGGGKLRLIAKGVRRPVSKMAGHLELFTHSRLLIAKGRNLDLITQSDTISSFLPLREDLLRTTYAHYVAELVDRLTSEQMEDYPLYALLLSTLGRLASDRQPVIAVRFFEVQMLGHLGYRPQLQHCVHCEQALEPVANSFSARTGGALCPLCGAAESTAKPLSVNALKVLRLLQSGNFELAVQLRMEEALSGELESHLRSALHQVLERDIKSVAFLNRLRSEAPVGPQR